MSRVVFTTTLALLCSAPLVSAGPINWSYTATVRTETGTGNLYIGEANLQSLPPGDPNGIPFGGEYVFYTPLAEFTVSGSGIDTDSFAPFFLPRGDGGRPVVHTITRDFDPPMDDKFLVTFTLKDEASGQTGTIDYAGTVRAAEGSGMYPGIFLFNLDMGPQRTELILGENKYAVESFGGLPDEIDEPAGARMRITPSAATVQTPEPTTLALAGLGLAAVGLTRRRR
jgi:hypothetical protein